MKIFQKFISLETSGGYGLLLAALIAIAWVNSPWEASYNTLINASFTVSTSNFSEKMSLSFILNEGLMTLFFFLVGLEVKRELLVGELNSVKKAILPGIAAIGGMVIPALIYVSFNWHDSMGIRGWAIPTATDIAFSLAVLSLLGTRIPLNLKIFLTALAIFDDLGAILIIAFFYTERISWLGLSFAALLEILLMLLNFFEIALPWIYGLVGILIWWLLYISGIHPTLAGVLVAFTVPLQTQQKSYLRPLDQVAHAIHPWVTFFILPLFAFFNSGVSFNGFLDSLITPVSLGIVFGLIIGKQLGVFGFCWLAIKSKVAELPKNMSWKNLYGIALLCGIGFTMSFFIGFLSFENRLADYLPQLRAGILVGSLLSGIFGYFWLCRISIKRTKI